MKRALSIFLFVCILFLSVSCRTEVPTFENTAASSKTVAEAAATEETDSGKDAENAKRAELFGAGNLSDTNNMPFSAGRHCWGDHIYYRGRMTDDSGSYITMLDYDISTGEIRPACADSVCTHRKGSSCPFLAVAGKGDAESGVVNYFVDEGVIYYIVRRVDQKGNVDLKGEQTALICSYNPSNMAYKILGEWAPCATSFFTKYKNMLYYIQYEAHREDEDYDIDLVSLDLSTGRTKKEYRLRENGNSPYGGPDGLTEDGTFLMSKAVSRTFYGAYRCEYVYNFYTLTLNDKPEIKTIAENVTVDTNSFNAAIIYKNSLFTQWQIKDINGQTVFKVEKIDLSSGEHTVLTEESTGGYTFAGKYLYYVPYAPEIVSVGDYPDMHCTSLGQIAQYNAETGETKVFTFPKDFWISGGLYMFAYNGRVYAPVYAAVESLYEQFGGLLGVLEIDLYTGSYRIVNGKVYA